MFKKIMRAASKATKRAQSANVRATKKLLKSLLAPVAKPVKRKRAAPKTVKASAPRSKPRAKTAAKQPRTGLGETLGRIAATARTVAPVRTIPPPGASFKTGLYSDENGKRRFKLYIPARAKLAEKAGTLMPVVVMLHGCSQTPDDFAAGTQMNALAEEFGVLVVYPEQPLRSNPHRCWNWYKPGDQSRDAGEPSLIAGITRLVLQNPRADPARVYIAGISAGGATSATLGATYPDLFAAIGIHSGLPAGAARDAATGLLAMQRGSPGSRLVVAMPTIVFHGEEDKIVNPRNGRYVAARAVAAFPRLTETVKRTRSPGGRYFTRTVYRALNRKSVCELWAVEGAGHAWAGGNPAGSFSDPAGPDASREMLKFFLRHRTTQSRRKSPAVLTPATPRE